MPSAFMRRVSRGERDSNLQINRHNFNSISQPDSPCERVSAGAGASPASA